MGFYENAFRLMRECYAELDRDPEVCHIADWRDAFFPEPFTGVTERTPSGEWLFWKAHLPATPGLPGDPFLDSPRFSMADYVARSAALLGVLFQSLEVASNGGSGSRDATEPNLANPAEQISRLLRYGEFASLAGLLEAARLFEVVASSLPLVPESLVQSFIEAIARNARQQIEARVEHDHEIRRLWTIIDLTLATIRGIFRFGLLSDPRGFDAIDEYDCREWLMLNGASQLSVDSGYLRALYDLGFSYEDGRADRPRIAAGQALRSMVRAFFTYRGSFFWKMRSGMGDIVFAPLYEVLKRRGVKFEFFHRLENVKLVDASDLEPGERSYVESLEFDVQADIAGDADYEPLVDVRGLPCWPADPRWEQLVGGSRLRDEGWEFESFWDRRKRRTRTLRVNQDFDFVVLGIGLGAVPYVCRDFVERDPEWRAMVENVKTVSTQAFQVWMNEEMRDLGWSEDAITVSGFVEPFDTWADMRHLILEESFEVEPRALAYFCNVLSDGEIPSASLQANDARRLRETVRRNAIHFLNHDVAQLWPGAVRSPGCFRWELLVDPEKSESRAGSAAGEESFESQWWTANVNPSDRYVLSLPGSQSYRISPLSYAYDNLTIAGDWTDCGFNAGCVEAAVMSGRLAAHALSGLPRLEDIVGYDHP
jgi:uncharacterized protein with NAD-binding domain and iron-sulfur cluster